MINIGADPSKTLRGSTETVRPEQPNSEARRGVGGVLGEGLFPLHQLGGLEERYKLPSGFGRR